jgi:hypothetical protein
MDKKFLKWTLILSYGFVILGFLGVMVYLLFPTLMSILLGVEDACSYTTPVSGGKESLQAAMSNLCLSSKMFIGGAIMIMILIGGFFASINVILSLIDTALSKISTGKKVIWIIAMLIFQIFASTMYYIIERKN